MKITVIGNGGWGTALALILGKNGHDVTIWGRSAEYCREVAQSRENRRFLPGIHLPPSLEITENHAAAVEDSEGIIIAIPTTFFRDVMTRFRPVLSSALPMISASKGFDRQTGSLMTEVAESLFGGQPVAALSGPSHAEEVARGVPTAVVVACRDIDHATTWQQWFNRDTFRTYTTEDVAGVQLGGALKNVIALATGISDGIGFGDNTKAALITRGLAEMTRLGTVVNAHPYTFAGLSGLGDLVATCTSTLSRNHRVGERLGKGETIEAILHGMEQVAEGIYACEGAHTLGRTENISLPITNEVYAVVHQGKNPRQAVQDLLSRDPKPERD